LAEEVAKSVDELPISGLDMIINKEANKATIIETNTKPMIGLHVFPHVGKPRDVVSSIVDFYFTETKNQPKSTLYFDFDTLIAPIKEYIVKEVRLEKVPYYNNPVNKKYQIYTKEELSEFYPITRQIMLKNKVYGTIRKQKSNIFEMILH